MDICCENCLCHLPGEGMWTVIKNVKIKICLSFVTMGKLVVKIKSVVVIDTIHKAQNETDLQWLYNFIVSEGKCCEPREGHEITCCHRDETTLNRFIISCHSSVFQVLVASSIFSRVNLFVSIWPTFQVNSWMNWALENGSLPWLHGAMYP